MKRIIEMEHYGTETAGLISSWETGPDRDDLRYYEEHLYRTRNGNWFRHGAGGATPMETCNQGQKGQHARVGGFCGTEDAETDGGWCRI